MVSCLRACSWCWTYLGRAYTPWPLPSSACSYLVVFIQHPAVSSQQSPRCDDAIADPHGGNDRRPYPIAPLLMVLTTTSAQACPDLTHALAQPPSPSVFGRAAPSKGAACRVDRLVLGPRGQQGSRANNKCLHRGGSTMHWCQGRLNAWEAGLLLGLLGLLGSLLPRSIHIVQLPQQQATANAVRHQS